MTSALAEMASIASQAASAPVGPSPRRERAYGPMAGWSTTVGHGTSGSCARIVVP